jgi:hypothetical protein
VLSDGNGQAIEMSAGNQPSWDSAAADDFVVPAGETWTVNDVSLDYVVALAGPADSSVDQGMKLPQGMASARRA